nr:ribonuclease H-like domain-containing protein [Tanacetum cinerariifolium]
MLCNDPLIITDDFVILEMEEYSKVTFILGRPFLHTIDAVIRVKQKQLNLGVETERMIFSINSVMKHSYSNDDTCFSIDVIIEEDFDALLDEGRKILHSIKGNLLKEEIFSKFDEFMEMVTDENSKSKSDTEELLFEKIAINTDYKIKTSLEEPPMDLELKTLPDIFEYVFLEEPSFLPFSPMKNDELVPTRTITGCVSYIAGLDLPKLAIILNKLKNIHSMGLTSEDGTLLEPYKLSNMESDTKWKWSCFCYNKYNGMIKVLPPKTAEEGMHKGYDRFQTLLSQLEIHGAGVLHKDVNQNFLSFDDLYNNLRVFKRDVKGTTASSSNTQNERSSSYTDEVIHSFFANQSSAPQLDYDDLEQINDDDMEEMYLKWQMAMISMRIKKFQKRTGRKLQFDTKDPVGLDKTKEECFNCHKMRHFARDCRAKRNQDSRRRDARLLNTQMSANDKFGLGYGDYIYGSILSYENEVLQSMFMNKESNLEDTSVNDRYADGMHAVPPLMTGNYMPFRPDVEIDYSKFTYG